LKAVVKPFEGGKKSARSFCVYDPVKSAKQGIKILNYDSLDVCPEFIHYEGDFDKDPHAVSMVANAPAKAA